MSRALSSLKYLVTGTLSLMIMAGWPLISHADCTLVPTAGDDSFTCSSSTGSGLADPSGNNSLTFPQNGTGTINGNVTFGAGNDLVQMSSGSIIGAVDMGGGANILQLFNGAISGSVHQGDGNNIVQVSGGSATTFTQGAGNDSFTISGGNITSLSQGAGHDIFKMSTGAITGSVEDGEEALMSGGSIGRVAMNLNLNSFEMLGGRIVGDLDAGIDNNTVNIKGGTVGGNIIVSGGGNVITVSAGEINGQVRGGSGNDIFTWDTGGLIHSAILMGGGNDQALLHNLTETSLSSTPGIDGGPGNDSLTFDNSQSASPGRYPHWETVNLDNGSRFNLNGDFVLGDSVSATGTFNVHGGSVLLVDQGSITPFSTGQLATLNNKGLIDMTSGNATATNRLTVRGNYFGDNGQLRLHSVLAGDDAASDKLVVERGTLQGSTKLDIVNLAGPGDLTRQNGILVVQALNGATGSDLAFTSSGPVSAGAYDYYLFKGGVTPGTAQNWYLRSAVVAPPRPEPEAPPVPLPNPEDPHVPLPTPEDPHVPLPNPEDPHVPLPNPEDPHVPLPNPEDPHVPLPNPEDPHVPLPGVVDGPGGTILPTRPDLPGTEPGKPPIPLYRPEVPVYSALLPAVKQMTLAALGTFHERQGDQNQQHQAGTMAAGWGRFYASNSRQTFAGTVNPRLDGSMTGYQVGSDLYGWTTADEQTQKIGFFVGHSRVQGDIDGFNRGFEHRDAGKSTLRGNSVGLYWTLIAPYGGYIDSVLMWTGLDINSESNRAVKLNTRGHAMTLSVEAGYPLQVYQSWVLEPQVQLITQHSALDGQNDGISDVDFDADNSVTARLGARLRGTYQLAGMPVLPYVRSNVWHTLSGTDRVTFNNFTAIDTQQKSTTTDLSMGMTVQVSSTLSLYGEAGYETQLDSNALNGRKATLGIRMEF
ncbi:autotransporter outer membrane beta-barrel domain-containing protein [Pseudomonas laurylsulfatiphila]|uniref:Autotransporter outer membrane beta-barrel domain-containing protein n=1 Tax=Pseudomonas laurylsulfatiphila TaxID=2011015 RepID=A0A2S6FP58_9PSED|nr:autotransporter outer membrane beta-barrel domain-containing protein [Pseudomonas laurylsulfatiphila]PPK39228.1 autotransporter outer membrane beta-barrel domain-containing protein [Pseudomonas laurylsulfatiphila]